MNEINGNEWNAFKAAWLIYSSYGPFTENKKRMQKFKETTDSRYIYRKNWTKLAFNMI